MKHFLAMFIAITLIVSCATDNAPSRESDAVSQRHKTFSWVELNTALDDFSEYIKNRVPDAALTAVSVTDAPVRRLGDYIADELIISLVNNTSLRVISRQDYERLLSEQDFQLSAHFSDASAAGIGKNLGWRNIVFAALEPLRETYRLTIRAVDVETGELYGTRSYILNGNDYVLLSIVNPDINIQRLNERDIILQPFDGRRNNFEIKVSTNKTVYYDGEEMFITLRSGEDCYFVVYHLNIDNNMQVIYPNFWETSNFLKANTERIIPEQSSFSLYAPYGEERILVYASARPFSIPDHQYQLMSITRDLLNSRDALWRVDDNEEGSKSVMVLPRGATGQVSYTILPGN